VYINFHKHKKKLGYVVLQFSYTVNWGILKYFNIFKNKQLFKYIYDIFTNLVTTNFY